MKALGIDLRSSSHVDQTEINKNVLLSKGFKIGFPFPNFVLIHKSYVNKHSKIMLPT